MTKVIFDSVGVTAALISRVHRTGIAMLMTVDKAHNKSKKVDPKIIEDLETDFLLANLELEYMLKFQLARENKDGWTLFVNSVSKLSYGERIIFGGVVRSIKLTANKILSDDSNPLESQLFESPPYIRPYFSIKFAGSPMPTNTDPGFTADLNVPTDIDPGFGAPSNFPGDIDPGIVAPDSLVINQSLWKNVLDDTEKLIKSDKSIGSNIADAAALATGAAAAAASGYPVAAVTGAFAAGWHIGEAINDYMGWHN